MGIEQIGNDGLLARFEQMNQSMRAMNQNARAIHSAFQNDLAANANQVNFMSGESAALALREQSNVNPAAHQAAAGLGSGPQAAGINNTYTPVPAEKAGETVGEFKQLLTDAFENVNILQNVAGEMSQRFDVGDRSITLADVMIASQKSSLSFEATLQIRNRLVEAYQSIMQMQI